MKSQMSVQPNLKEYTVSELSGAVKRSLEDGFGFVRVRGELGRVVRAGSGHVYLDLKDDRAVLLGVMWKATAARQSIAPEQGMEVIASGKLSTFPGQSKYQLIIDSVEPAGAGALMALLEERKKKLAAEGLFDPDRKREIPFLPAVIGVVTSPSGAVIRDILHRLRDRFPTRVIVWPTLVQGRGAEAQIAAAIDGFNALTADSGVPRPDVLIVARGGGSIEDLWCFNEEVVVRAAARSSIPLISAVGHETDTTLIDFAADRRAPTPTAAAEIAVPVRSELLAETLNKTRRLEGSISRLLESARGGLRAAERGLGRPEDIFGAASQRLDRFSDRLAASLSKRLSIADAAFARSSSRLLPGALRPVSRASRDRFKAAADRLVRAKDSLTRPLKERVTSSAKLLESLSHRNVLARGFALVRAEDGAVIRTSSAAIAARDVRLIFADGECRAATEGFAPGGPAGGSSARASSGAVSKKGKARRPQKTVQETLFD
ncbi:MAG: exodeoxyribonuclease VII large subunit [Alphaproteobacteria bacterium]|nr:exodeoxyribonuclease VII large subunit [Alphaproteobacteria bacterium]